MATNAAAVTSLMLLIKSINFSSNGIPVEGDGWNSGWSMLYALVRSQHLLPCTCIAHSTCVNLLLVGIPAEGDGWNRDGSIFYAWGLQKALRWIFSLFLLRRKMLVDLHKKSGTRCILFYCASVCHVRNR